MSGSFGEMGNLLKQAQQMQRELDKVKEELRQATVEGTAGGGAVRVVLTGARHVEKVEISEEILKTADKSMLEDLILAALRDGMQRAEDLSQKMMGKVTGGIQLPGMF